MSDILIPYGGGGVDLDVVTATATDVRKGKVIVDKNGDPLTGTMTEKAAATYTPGTANQTIAANQYLTGVQTIKGDSKLLAANIKKGVSIFGVTGSWEGYVAAATDLYYKGNNAYSFTGNNAAVYFGSDRIQITKYSYPQFTAGKAFTWSGYTKLIVNFNLAGVDYYTDADYYIAVIELWNGSTKIKTSRTNMSLKSTLDLVTDITALAGSFAPKIYLSVEYYNDAHGSDSDPSWSRTPFTGNVFGIRVA